ncbi:MAG: LemA family protein [Muribaculaceae bacterium]|nr:LemA family protein [Muribaculaceae bacterium]MBQ7851922.1 LemA family protein [Muribaculaceae bacterium]MBR1963224.1 LemA family protein [Muribaculaceae bacterium]
MANLLDEVTGPVNDNGRDVRVIDRQLPVEIGFGSTIFEIALWVTIPILVLIYVALMGNTLGNPLMVGIIGCLVGILPGVIFIFMKISARNYFQQLEQRIQAEASNIDNYLEQRVQILQNVVGILDRAIDLDKDVMKAVAALRGGRLSDDTRSEVNAQVNTAFRSLFPQVEAYPELKAHNAIADAMQQNNYLQREITAARTVYNSRVTQWNTDIFRWPTKMIVAARQGYTTRIPFSVSAETRDMARSKFF